MANGFGSGIARRDPGHTLAQPLAAAFPLRQLFDQRQRRVTIAKARLKAVEFTGADEAFLEQLHHEGRDRSGADRVDAVLVAQQRHADNRIVIGNGAVRAHGVDRLVFRPFQHFAVDLARDLAARDGTAEAGVILLPGFFLPGLAADFVRAFKLPLLKVARGQGARHIDEFQDVGRAFLVHAGNGAGHAHRPAGELQRAIEPRPIGHRHPAGPARDDGLQMLRAHHRAHAAARQRARIVEDAGDVGLFLARRPDDQRFPIAPEVAPQALGGRGDRRAPQLARGADFHPIVVDHEETGSLAAPCTISAS